ncbi:hypothetical protein [Ruminococcus sp.]|uniref:hypothetical protein n=1 Tax=Ruminococcus sp. TaxID=41978 RepID=UPI0025FD89E4|nr:hypothetical protein [Ruminococcus sp.]
MKRFDVTALLGSVGMNLLINLWGAIPAVILLVLHFTIGVPMWFFWIALAGWVVIIGTMTVLMHWISIQPSLPEKPRENKNPYSKKGYEPINLHRG